MEEVPRQLQQCKALRQHAGRQLLGVALLRHQKFVAQILGRKAAVQECRLQHRMPGNVALDALRVNFTLGLALQIAVAADVVGIGMGVVDGGQMPAVGVQQLPHLAACVLVVAAVNQADVCIVQLHKTHLGGALDIVAIADNVIQFVHKAPLFL